MLKRLILIICVLHCGLSMAQERESYYSEVQPDSVTGLRHYRIGDNWFISLHGGANMGLGENVRPREIGNVLGWSAGLSVGKFFTPQVGARVQLVYQRQHGMANKEAVDAYPQYYGNGAYGFYNFTGYLDGVFNLHNIFKQFTEERKFNIMFLVGFGANIPSRFDTEKLYRWQNLTNGSYPVYPKSKLYFAMRTGFQFTYFISKAWDLQLEVTMNATNDKYNGVIWDDKYDGYVKALLGLTYHFKDHHGDHRFRFRRLTDSDVVSDFNERINEARAELNNIERPVRKVAIQERKLEMTVSFFIDRYDITDVQRKNVEAVANFIKANDDVDVVVTGYADVETANPEYNMRLSENRSKAVYNMLINDYGVDPARLSMGYMGDVEQPYRLKNEWNRVVVFYLKPHSAK